ncbi:hypothetical protein SDC9_21024 [bioreactor metagenome]|jgi:surface polysaccharide O-acyltransferase-like enzyme|uniref:Uncharacterized protein n=1 Tax=bioreactor metagenome TaxID=1076179 RepID=A0A644U8S4_9ZZZZ|nr:hypothetical protein [Lentimicrobium sp.]MCO5267021.1 hypothetical protein [Lentimicrobium sp.]MEA5109918.1 hypothetical protein [Lentimicrobium sp.]
MKQKSRLPIVIILSIFVSLIFLTTIPSNLQGFGAHLGFILPILGLVLFLPLLLGIIVGSIRKQKEGGFFYYFEKTTWAAHLVGLVIAILSIIGRFL